jgi:2-polyprenyl-3-methyl-5-hydroxy-6-metoxy-1,4-benzoquinol methylase
MAISLAPEARLSLDDERAHYLTHENEPDDSGYQRFLEKLLTPLRQVLPPNQRGLDFGCGPGPTLSPLMRAAGHEMVDYDPLFAPDHGRLDSCYDFITATEVVEHFGQPAACFDQLDQLLRGGGWLGVMTEFQSDDKQFANWRYRRDPTHVTFYRAETFRWLAHDRGWFSVIPEKNIVLMQKPRR